MEFVTSASGDEVEVLEATETVEMSGRSITDALKALKGRDVNAIGIEDGRLWARVRKEA